MMTFGGLTNCGLKSAKLINIRYKKLSAQTINDEGLLLSQ